MLQAVMNAFRLPDLRRRILFTVAILALYRFLAFIPVPGVDLQGDFRPTYQVIKGKAKLVAQIKAKAKEMADKL